MNYANLAKVTTGDYTTIEFGYEDPDGAVAWGPQVELPHSTARLLETALSAQRQVREMEELRARKEKNRAASS